MMYVSFVFESLFRFSLFIYLFIYLFIDLCIYLFDGFKIRLKVVLLFRISFWRVAIKITCYQGFQSLWQYLRFGGIIAPFAFFFFLHLCYNTAAFRIPQASPQGELVYLDIVKILTCQTDAFHRKNNYLPAFS